MSVVIPGMEMPKNCWECPCFVSDGWFCNLDDECRDVYDGRPDWCQLIELPKKHGDLIDRQKLIEDNRYLAYPTDGKCACDRAWAVGFNAGARHCNEHAIYAKTVIEAEGED